MDRDPGIHSVRQGTGDLLITAACVHLRPGLPGKEGRGIPIAASHRDGRAVDEGGSGGSLGDRRRARRPHGLFERGIRSFRADRRQLRCPEGKERQRTPLVAIRKAASAASASVRICSTPP